MYIYIYIYIYIYVYITRLAIHVFEGFEIGYLVKL